MDLYLSKHLFNDGTFGESVWKQPGDDVKQRNSSGSAKIETLKTSFKVFTKISPYQIRHRCEVKKRLEITSIGPHFHTSIYCQKKRQNIILNGPAYFFWGVFCGDARTTRLWVVSVGYVKFVRLLCFSGFR